MEVVKKESAETVLKETIKQIYPASLHGVVIGSTTRTRATIDNGVLVHLVYYDYTASQIGLDVGFVDCSIVYIDILTNTIFAMDITSGSKIIKECAINLVKLLKYNPDTD